MSVRVREVECQKYTQEARTCFQLLMTARNDDDDRDQMLRGLGNYYVDYAGAIRAKGYETIDELRGVEIDELVEMGVKRGHAKRILRAVFES